MALCATTALAGAVPRLCVRGARGRFGGFGPVPGVVSLSFPPSRPACSALRVAGRPVRVSLTLAHWYAIPRGLCVSRARSGCPSGSPRVPLLCVCARGPAASALPPSGWRGVGVAEGPSTVVRSVCGQVLPLLELPAHWAGCWSPAPTCCGRGRVGVGAQHCPLGPHALWGLRAAGVVGGRPRGGWPATVVRGVWCQALSLPLPPVLWGGRPGFRDPCVPVAVGAGVGTQHRPHSVRLYGLAFFAVGVVVGHPRGGCLPPL